MAVDRGCAPTHDQIVVPAGGSDTTEATWLCRILRAERAGPPSVIGASLGVVPEEVGSSGPPWRLEVSDANSPKEDTG
jgi:hypothetical protein